MIRDLLMCVLDDDAKAFQFHPTKDPTHLMNSVMSAIAARRRVRCYALRGGADAPEREAKFLLGRGYSCLTITLG